MRRTGEAEQQGTEQHHSAGSSSDSTDQLVGYPSREVSQEQDALSPELLLTSRTTIHRVDEDAQLLSVPVEPAPC